MSTRRSALIAEDEPVIGMELEEALREQVGSIEVFTVVSVEEGLTLARRALFDFALVDVRLSDGDCDELIALLAERGVPFALCSGFSSTNLTLRYGDLPMLSKPYKNRDLAAILTRLLGSKPIRRVPNRPERAMSTRQPRGLGARSPDA
jgi:ActR/RegA family two-component response regulator